MVLTSRLRREKTKLINNKWLVSGEQINFFGRGKYWSARYWKSRYFATTKFISYFIIRWLVLFSYLNYSLTSQGSLLLFSHNRVVTFAAINFRLRHEKRPNPQGMVTIECVRLTSSNSQIQNKRATKGFILIRHKRYQICSCLPLSSSVASFVWKPAHFEFRSYGGAWHNTKIAFVEKYTLFSWYLVILGVKVSGKVLF